MFSQVAAQQPGVDNDQVSPAAAEQPRLPVQRVRQVHGEDGGDVDTEPAA